MGRLAGVVVAVVAAACLAAAAEAFSGWAVVPSPNVGTYGSLLKGVSARTASDAWAVGGTARSSSNDTLAVHWNGSSWSAVSTPNPVASCQDGNIQWTGNTLNAVAVVGATQAWAVGTSCYSQSTLVERWDGSSWQIVPSPSLTTGGDGIENDLYGVAAVTTSDVWAAGFYAGPTGADLTLVEHWNGSAWKVVPSPNPSAFANVLRGVAATGSNDVWAVGYRNGSGSQPLIEHWNGSAWTTTPTPTLATGGVLNAVVALSPTNAWAVGYQTSASTGAELTLAEHWNGSTWSVVPTPNLATSYGSANVLNAVAAISAGDIWAAGMYQNANTNYHQHRTLTLHWNGTSWAPVTSPTPGATGELNAISALTTPKLFAVGLYSQNPLNIYDGTYTNPKTLVLAG